MHFGLVVLVLCFAGCSGSDDGPKTVTVSGEVILDGKPLEDGEIVFLPADGQGRSDAGRISEGHYSFESTLGEKKVDIQSWQEIPGTVKKLESGEEGGEVEQVVPAKYNDETTLTANVTDSGEKTFNFALEKE